MSIHKAHAHIELEIKKIASSRTPAPDRTYIEGMIEMAFILGHLPRQGADAYREVLALKFGDRVVQLRSIAA